MGGGEGLFRSQGYLGRRDHSDDELGILGKERASGGGRVMEQRMLHRLPQTTLGSLPVP